MSCKPLLSTSLYKIPFENGIIELSRMCYIIFLILLVRFFLLCKERTSFLFNFISSEAVNCSCLYLEFQFQRKISRKIFIGDKCIFSCLKSQSREVLVNLLTEKSYKCLGTFNLNFSIKIFFCLDFALHIISKLARILFMVRTAFKTSKNF